MSEPSIVLAQRRLCARVGAEWRAAPADLTVGIARNVGTGLLPLNGLRHPPKGDTTGWYLWAGSELSSAPDFFQPLHVVHLQERCPQVLAYLGLAPGWRFLLAPNHEDVWFDAELLHI